MVKISEMIEKFCPEGVKHVRLGNISEIGTGSGNRQDAVEDGVYPFFVRSKEVLLSDTYEFDEEAILIPGEGGIGEIFHYYKGKYALHQRTYRIHITSKELNTKFFYYYLVSNFKSYILRKAVASTATSIRKPMIEDYVIPIPPLSIQQEIVRILDTFTQLQSNLEAELTARQKQYEYYRNKLLTFDMNDESVEWKTLGEIGTILRGNGLQKSDFSEDGVGCIHYGQIYTRLVFSCDKTLTYVPKQLAKSLTKVEPGNLVIACTSENVEDVCKSVVWLGNEDIVTGGHACVFKHNENPKYIGYCFITNDFFNQKKKYAYGAKVIDIKTEKLAQIKIPIPSREHQDEIVSKLDSFEALITNIKQEIEARKKQYEYYREQLLTFN